MCLWCDISERKQSKPVIDIFINILGFFKLTQLLSTENVKDIAKDMSPKSWNLPTARFNSKLVLFIDPRVFQKISFKKIQTPQGPELWPTLLPLFWYKTRFSIFLQMLAKQYYVIKIYQITTFSKLQSIFFANPSSKMILMKNLIRFLLRNLCFR